MFLHRDYFVGYGKIHQDTKIAQELIKIGSCERTREEMVVMGLVSELLVYPILQICKSNDVFQPLHTSKNCGMLPVMEKLRLSLKLIVSNKVEDPQIHTKVDDNITQFIEVSA